MIKILFQAIVLFFVVHAHLTEAHGLVIYGGKSVQDLGMYVAEVTYFAYTDTEAELTVTMCNLSRATNGSHITGFAFVTPADHVQQITPGSDFPITFQVFGNPVRPDSSKLASGKVKEFGATLSQGFPDWVDLSAGLPPDQADRATAFRFLITGRGLYSLQETDFVPDAAHIRRVSSGGPREGSCFFAVRFADAQGKEHILGRANYWLR